MSNLTILEKVAEAVNKHAPKFKLGDTVVPKFTGLPNIGIIVGIEMAPLYAVKSPHSDLTRWNNLFTDWFEKYVYVLTFNEKVCPISLSEYNEIKIKYPEIMPYEDYPKVGFIAYPEDDLELFE